MYMYCLHISARAYSYGLARTIHHIINVIILGVSKSNLQVHFAAMVVELKPKKVAY